jgi:hypothetical protein
LGRNPTRAQPTGPRKHGPAQLFPSPPFPPHATQPTGAAQPTDRPHPLTRPFTFPLGQLTNGARCQLSPSSRRSPCSLSRLSPASPLAPLRDSTAQPPRPFPSFPLATAPLAHVTGQPARATRSSTGERNRPRAPFSTAPRPPAPRTLASRLQPPDACRVAVARTPSIAAVPRTTNPSTAS